MKNWWTELVISAALLLSGCGGGGGETSTPVTPPSTPKSYTVGGNVSGLSGTGLQLQNNGKDTLTVSASGAFTFGTTLSDGAGYAVTVLSQPAAQTCAVSSGTGTIAAGNVTNVAVSCTNNPPTPLAVTGILPAQQATSVARNSSVTATFNRAVSAASVTSTSATITGPEGNLLPVPVAANGPTVQWTPTGAGFPGGTQFGVTLSTAVTDASSNALPAPFTSQFTTVAQQWASNAAQLAPLNINTGGLHPLAVLAGPNGDVTAFWFHVPTSATALDMARYSAATGTWSAATTIYTPSGSNGISGLNAGIDSNGNITLVWCEGYFGGPGLTAMSAQIAASANALSATPQAFAPVPAVSQQGGLSMAIDAAGDITVVSPSSDANGTPCVYAVRRIGQSSTWSTPAAIPVTSSSASYAKVTMDSHGGAVAAWLESPSSSNPPVAKAAAYDPSTATWSSPTIVAPAVLTGLFSPFVMTTDTSGVTTMAWTVENGVGGIYNIAAARYTPATGQWSSPTRLDQATAGSGAFYPGIAVDGAGYVTAAWVEFASVKAARFNPTTGAWSASVQIGPGPSGYGPIVLADVAGNVTVLIVSNNVEEAIQYTSTDASWHAPVAIDTLASGSNLFPETPLAAIDSSGAVTTVWFSDIMQPTRMEVVLANTFK